MNPQLTHTVIESNSVEDTMALGATFAKHVKSGDCIALIGELGAGKTQFVRGLARGLGLDPARVSSPTFVFLQEYDPPNHAPDTPVLAHVDAYRLVGEDDLASIGWEGDGEELRRGAVLVVEWADRIPNALCTDRLEVNLIHHGNGRTITLTPHGNWRDRLTDMKTPHPTARCPICQKSAAQDSPDFPFCSERCKQIDLGKWLKGDYLISRPVEESDLDEGE